MNYTITLKTPEGTETNIECKEGPFGFNKKKED